MDEDNEKEESQKNDESKLDENYFKQHPQLYLNTKINII